jgi:hypothetical protein
VGRLNNQEIQERNKTLKVVWRKMACWKRKKTTEIRGESETKIDVGVQANPFYDGVQAS